eukprot:1196267-Prorocentrum_minimum.AAC.8
MEGTRSPRITTGKARIHDAHEPPEAHDPKTAPGPARVQHPHCLAHALLKQQHPLGKYTWRTALEQAMRNMISDCGFAGGGEGERNWEE